ncbi:MAG: thermonuclease family protein [Deltaproteobacteria bacterium]|nr:thermonuclease family protein [Deltaproteobacteria bacterium]
MKDYIRWPLIVLVLIVLALLLHLAKALDVHEVIEVYDGDTIKVDDGTIIRLIGVDAPEVDSPYGKAEPFGSESKRYLKKLLYGRKVKMSVGPQPFDRYNRTLAYVYLTDGTLINGRIIKDGWARAYTRFDFKHKDLFVTYEKEARAKGLGIWQDRK